MINPTDLVAPEEEQQPAPAPWPPSETVPEFCAIERMSLATYAKMRKLGVGPDETRIPGLKIVRITYAAHQEWRERMANPPPAMQRKIDSDFEARSKRMRAAGKLAAASPKHPCRTKKRRR